MQTNDLSFSILLARHKKRSFPLKILPDLVTFTEETLNGKLRILCSVESITFAIQFIKKYIVKYSGMKMHRIYYGKFRLKTNCLITVNTITVISTVSQFHITV